VPTDDSAVSIDDSPGDRIKDAVARFGEKDVAERSAALLVGANAGEEFLLIVGGRHAQGVLDGAPPLYWPEVWGARALTYVWDDSAASAVRAGLANQAWRVREMCARVVAVRALPFADELLPLLTDEVARVRAAGAKALAVVGEFENVLPIKALLKDPDVDVRRRAGEALREASARLDRKIE
jgi:HEAT repeat protein